MSGSLDQNYMKQVLQVITELKCQMNEMKAEMAEKHQNQISRLENLHEKDLEQVKLLYQEECDGYKIDLNQKNGEISNLKSDLQIKNTTIQNLEQSIVAKDQKNNSLELELNGKTTEIGSLNSNLQKLNAKIQNIEQTNINKDQKIQQLGNDLNTRDQTISSLRSSINAKNSENSSLRSDLNSKSRAYSSLQNDLSNVRQENRRLESTINDKRRENENLNSRLYDKNREVRNLQSQLNDKIAENGRLQSSLDVYKKRERQEREDEKRTDYSIYDSKMSSSMDNEAINAARRGFSLYGYGFDMAKYIANRFIDKYGGKWTCVEGKICDFHPYFWYRNDHKINFRFGNREIYLFENYW